MGTDIYAVLAIDDNSPADGPPFVSDPSYWDLTKDVGLSGGKHYEFYAAISGIRDETGIPPLIPPRGAPPYMQPEKPTRTSPAAAADRGIWPYPYPVFDNPRGGASDGLLTFEFQAAAFGVSDETGASVPPYSRLEALPLAAPVAAADEWDGSYPMFDLMCGSATVGWLTLTEIDAAMRHHGLDRARLDASVLLVLDAMEAAERRYGRDRVHLVFGIE